MFKLPDASCLREFKLISNSPYGLDVFFIRIFSQLSPQTGDHTLYRIVCYTDFLFPDMGINLLLREHPARMSGQKAEKIKLISCKRQKIFLQPYLSAFWVDTQFPSTKFRKYICRLLLQDINLQFFPLFNRKYVLKDFPNLYTR